MLSVNEAQPALPGSPPTTLQGFRDTFRQNTPSSITSSSLGHGSEDLLSSRGKHEAMEVAQRTVSSVPINCLRTTNAKIRRRIFTSNAPAKYITQVPYLRNPPISHPN